MPKCFLKLPLFFSKRELPRENALFKSEKVYFKDRNVSWLALNGF